MNLSFSEFNRCIYFPMYIVFGSFSLKQFKDYLMLSCFFFLWLQYVLLYTFENCDPVNKVYYCDLSMLPDGLEGFRGKKELLPFVKLVDRFDASYTDVANDGTVFTFRTNKDAPRYKLVQVDLKEPTSWIEILPESEKDVLESAVAVNSDQLVVSYLSDVKNVLQLRDLKTGALLHHLPVDIGTVAAVSARRKDNILFIKFTSFLVPGIIYQCNLGAEAPHMKIFREIVVPGFDRTDFVVNQVNFHLSFLVLEFKFVLFCRLVIFISKL